MLTYLCMFSSPSPSLFHLSFWQEGRVEFIVDAARFIAAERKNWQPVRPLHAAASCHCLL